MSCQRIYKNTIGRERIKEKITILIFNYIKRICQLFSKISYSEIATCLLHFLLVPIPVTSKNVYQQ